MIVGVRGDMVFRPGGAAETTTGHPLHPTHQQEFIMANQQTQQDPQQVQQFQACIDACLVCAKTCETCGSACLAEASVAEMARCIRMNQDCAGVCFTAASLMSRCSEYAQSMCQLCADVCEACGAECAKYSMTHCQQCAQACKSCAQECRKMAGGPPRQKAA
ncbi:four-helix bundle copper-binding protein [Nannocystis punicea]|uniref:Four-helix bundle copper-binding protein n=1 Tax=Nannocystis punicea TaxID=2995304 RepID=A0ABY7GX05_9BACT|nr:four-helix bundle copper-binding protein [Nannocystis poenicansa]WAS91497.1 four-helix bundle copper-binding protein [Nannocystis poenicansa]